MRLILLIMVSVAAAQYTSYKASQNLLMEETKDLIKKTEPVYRELVISFEYAEIAKQKLSRIFHEQGHSLEALMKYPDPFEKFYVSNLDLKTFYPTCPICEKSFKSREYLHLHIVRKHLSDRLDPGIKYVAFSDACEFMKCRENQMMNEDLKYVNLQRCMQFLEENFAFDSPSQVYRLCKGIVACEKVSGNKQEVLNQIFGWLFFVAFIILSFILVLYVVDAHVSEGKSAFINLAKD